MRYSLLAHLTASRRWQPVAQVLGLAGLLLSAGCSYTNGNKDKDVPAPCGIDAAAVTYALDIAPILQKNCLQCHGEKVYRGSGGGHNWDNFSEFQQEALSGTLAGVLEQTDPRYAAIYMPRPIGSTKLSACDIERIKAWVAKGAPQK